ncbi:hypothetical protein Osc7112_1595 [Oscillatoria nigro-viridis PCC 7112]|uniref:Uncharacterized protein n=1 Tax=Phormidium nigroviride PCC 7112 TaxID=179408 RepID=K9VFV7_9CYAN|nr:hypothetical protein [Oscillatoria nigro-viridis]AFZ06110.1 hypothetical protein Osc7112_1595 [Oscillatoria nigro-viridis PCC 7112]
MTNYLEKSSKVGQGAWAAKAIYDLTVTALLKNQFNEVEEFIGVFNIISGDFGGEAAARKLRSAANLLSTYGNQKQLASSPPLKKLRRQRPPYIYTASQTIN